MAWGLLKVPVLAVECNGEGGSENFLTQLIKNQYHYSAIAAAFYLQNQLS